MAHDLAGCGYDLIGVDPSLSGIEQGLKTHPGLKLFQGSSDEDLAAKYGSFPVVLSFEVIEHVYFPRQFARRIWDLVEPSGMVILSTPYHGYLKNCALAISGRLDAHFTALWDHGHIKFWSFKTLGQLLRESGFVELTFYRVGRIPVLAKSMIVTARKPASTTIS